MDHPTSADRPRGPDSPGAPRGGGHLPGLGAVAVLGFWTATGHPLWLGVAAVATGMHILRMEPVGGRIHALSGVVLLLAVVTGFLAEGQLREVTRDWASLRMVQEERLGDRLARELDRLLEEGEAVAAAAGTLDADPGWEMNLRLSRIRRGTLVDALALYDGDGRLEGWDGLHQGAVPAEVALGQGTYLYTSRPLFGYLYISAPRRDGAGTAVSAVLLHTDLPPGMEAGLRSFAGEFQTRFGGRLTVLTADQAHGEGIWDLGRGEETLLSLRMEPPTQTQILTETRGRWVTLVLALAFLFWLLVLASGPMEGRTRMVSAGALLTLASVLPAHLLPGPPSLASPVDFALPGPGDLSMGRLMLLAAAGVMILGLIRRDGSWLPPPVAALLGGVAFTGLAYWVGAGAATQLLAGGEGGWAAYFLLLALSLTWVAAVVVRSSRKTVSSYPPRAWMAAAGLGTLVLGVGASLLIRVPGGMPSWLALAWALPLVPLGQVAVGGRPPLELGRWVVLALVGGSLALPLSWGQRLEARATMAEEEVERLRTPVDPYLEFILSGLGDQFEDARSAGALPVEILYRGWVASGMVWEGVPVWLTYWSPGGLPLDELRIGVPGPRPVLPVTLTGATASSPELRVRRMDLPDIHYLAVHPLGDGGVVTAVVPPRRSLGRVPVLAGLSASLGGSEGASVTVVPLPDGDPEEPLPEPRWSRTPDGWHGEFTFPAPDQMYQVHFDVEVASPLVRVARATLLLLFHLSLVLLLWGLCAVPMTRDEDWLARFPRFLSTFQARVTAALFAFFLVPTILLGTLAQGALAAASARTAQTLAERAVEEAARWYEELQGSMDLLAGRAGGELLLYQGGALSSGFPRELVELGFYPGWLPADVHLRLQAGETLLASRIIPFGGRDHALAFRRLPEGRVLAASAPVQAGAAALRQRDLLDLLGFSIFLGASLSLALAVSVGRALSQPIQALRVASERVGAGNLGVRLPARRSDEFGPVFEAFSRMVRRLRRARRALVRSSRRTRAIVEEAATGVVALDPAGRVTLTNPRAVEFLGSEIRRGERLSGETEPATELARWVAEYFREGWNEAGTELSAGERRIRVRARRISRHGASGGAVLSLEDVTDELRSERILAWGEMARQVAHEVKNPLTPVKLGVQHIRRAWLDERTDFGEILERNASAILMEIDRLAAIATSFSRFGAPGEGAEGPVERVDLPPVIREVMTLYDTGEDGIRVVLDLHGGLPPVRARVSEVKEVLVNLLENARQALPRGGEVRVRGSRFADFVVLEVVDEGVGIEGDLLPRIFEPHFSTRSSGSGLGLAIVKRIVEAWGGSVEARSEPARGTTLRVFLPLWAPEEPEATTGSIVGREATSGRGDEADGPRYLSPRDPNPESPEPGP